MDLTKDKDGNIYVLDQGNCNIKKFDSLGIYITTFGRKGQGPAEFMNPMVIDVDNKFNIYVVDMKNNRFSVLSPSGEEISNFKMSYNDKFLSFTLLNSNEIVAFKNLIIETYMTNDLSKFGLLNIFDYNGKLLRKIGNRHVFNNILYERSYGNQVFIATDSDDNIYVNFKHFNRIEKYSSEGRLLFSVERPLNYKIKHRIVKVTNQPRISERPFMTFVSYGIGIDHCKRIWVITFTKQAKRDDKTFKILSYAESVLEIFDSDGFLLGKVPLPEKRGMMRIFKDKIYFINNVDIPCIYEYNIIEK